MMIRYPNFFRNHRYYRFGGLMVVLFFVFLSSCRLGNNRLTNIKTSDDGALSTDSVVVAQLITRSDEFVGSNPELTDQFDGFLREALDIAERRNMVEQEVEIYNKVGKRYRDRSDYGDALKYHHKALDLAQRMGNDHLLAYVYNQIGVVYRRTDDNAMALDMHFKALKLSEQLNDTFNTSVAINSIGNVNFNLGRYHTAVEYFLRSLELSRKMDNTLGLAINENNIGECLLKLGQPDSALIYYGRSLMYNLQIGSQNGESICYNSIGSAYMIKGNLTKALGYLLRSLQINEGLDDLMQVAISQSKIGQVYFLMDDYDEAYKYFKSSYDLAVQIGSRFQAEESARQLSHFYEKRGRFYMAMDYYRIASAYKDSILNEKNMYHLTTVEVMLEAEKQRERISELNQETLSQQYTLSRQRWIIIIFGILAVVTLLVTLLLVNQHRLRNRYQDLRNQHKLLRSQMNPHFIFNALSAIQVYVLEHDIDKSTKFLTDFAKLMRLVLKLSHQDYITLKDETEILKYYLELQKLRFNIPFIYNIEVDRRMELSEVLVPPMITQPFVENAVEHGIKTLQGEGRINIRFIKAEGQVVVVEVEDNGIGITASKQQKNEKDHESMAIKITKERLEVIHNDSGGKVNLEIIDKKKMNPFDRGTIVKIEFPEVRVNVSEKNKHLTVLKNK
jgi:tetratricopeptide (TPR) repeat protein